MKLSDLINEIMESLNFNELEIRENLFVLIFSDK